LDGKTDFHAMQIHWTIPQLQTLQMEYQHLKDKMMKKLWVDVIWHL